MNILFENTYLRDESLHKEFYRYIFFQRKLILAPLILMSISSVINLFISFFGNNPDYSLVYIPIIIFSVITINYFRSVKLANKRDNELCNEGISINVTVYDDCIIRKTSLGDEVQLSFDKYKYAVQTKNFIFLFSNTNVATTFRKDSFTKGDIESFMRFLQSKNIKIK